MILGQRNYTTKSRIAKNVNTKCVLVIHLLSKGLKICFGDLLKVCFGNSTAFNGSPILLSLIQKVQI